MIGSSATPGAKCPETGFGTLEVLDAGAPSVLAHRFDWEEPTIVAVHELGGKKAKVTIERDRPDKTPRP